MTSSLAIDGGPRTRTEPMPARRALGPAERAAVEDVFDWYESRDSDPGYKGVFEQRYADAFAAFHGGGHAAVVATGTAAVYVALKALELPAGSEVIVSPITDPGSFNAIILAGLVPSLADAAPGGFNIGAEQVAARLTPRSGAVMLVHNFGQPADVAPIAALAAARGLKLVEDCSQSHGASLGGRKVGTFGDIAAFSTMYRKAHMTGASGGVVYSRDLALHRLALAHGDRGKPRWQADFDDRDPAGYLFPALNLNSDEISCAIGEASLARLTDSIARRLDYGHAVARGLEAAGSAARLLPIGAGDSPFMLPVRLDLPRKTDFAKAVRAEGIDLNPDYRYLAADWPWLRPYLADDFEPRQARRMRDACFMLYLNERYGPAEARDTVAAILKVEGYWKGRCDRERPM
jgi:dTDP-4-amino-4,6-dideoxygalactose transaminase